MFARKNNQESPKSEKKVQNKTQENAEKQTKSGYLQRTNPSNINNSKMVGSPKSSQKGKDPNEQQHSKKIEAQKDYSSGSSNSFENLVNDYVCPCTKCQPNGLKDITQTDLCYNELFINLNLSSISADHNKLPNIGSQQNLLKTCKQKIENVVQQLITLVISQTQIVQKFKAKSSEQELIKIKEQLSNSQKKIQHLEEEMKIATQQLGKYIVSLADKEKQIQAQKDQQSQWKRSLTEKQELISSMNQKDADKQKQISRLTAEKAELKNDLLKTKKNHASLEQKYIYLETQKAGLVQEIQLNQIRLSELLVEIQLLKDQLGQYKMKQTNTTQSLKLQFDSRKNDWQQKMEKLRAEHTQKVTQIQHQKLQLQQQLKGKEQAITNCQASMKYLQELYCKDKFEWSKQREKMTKQIASLESLNKKLEEDVNANNLSLEAVKGVLQETKKQSEQKLTKEKLQHFKKLQKCEQKHKQQIARLTQSKDKSIEEIQKTHQLQIGNLTNQSTQLQQEKLRVESQLAECTKNISQLQQQKLQLQDQLKEKEEIITNRLAAVIDLQELYSKDKFEWSEQREKMAKNIRSLEQFNKKLEEDINAKYQSHKEQVKGVLQQTKTEFESKLNEEKLKHKQQISLLTELKDKQIQECQKAHRLIVDHLKKQQMYELTAERNRNIELQKKQNRWVSNQLAEHTKKITQLQLQKLQLEDSLKAKEQIISNTQAAVKALQEIYSKDKIEWAEQRKQMIQQIDFFGSSNNKLEIDATSQFSQKIQFILQQRKEQCKHNLKWEKLKYFKESQKQQKI